MVIKSDVSTFLAVAALIAGGALGWASLSGKMERLSEQVGDLSRDKADRECLAILARQSSASDQNRKEISALLNVMAEQRGCFDRTGAMMAANAEMPKLILNDNQVTAKLSDKELAQTIETYAKAFRDGSPSKGTAAFVEPASEDVFWSAMDRFDAALLDVPEK